MYMHVSQNLKICEKLSLQKGFGRDLRELYACENLCAYSTSKILSEQFVLWFGKVSVWEGLFELIVLLRNVCMP